MSFYHTEQTGYTLDYSVMVRTYLHGNNCGGKKYTVYQDMSGAGDEADGQGVNDAAIVLPSKIFVLSDDTVKKVDAGNLTRSAATTSFNSFKKATQNDHDAEFKYNLEYCATKQSKAMGSSPVVSQEAGCDVQAALEACVTAKDAKRLKKLSSNQPQGVNKGEQEKEYLPADPLRVPLVSWKIRRKKVLRTLQRLDTSKSVNGIAPKFLRSVQRS